MNTIKIITPQNIDLEYELGSLGDRILGRIIDGLVLVAYGLIFAAIIGFSNIGDFISSNGWLVVLIVILPIFFYDLISEILLNGQSFGKKVMSIRVISLNGEQPTLSQYLIRWVFRLIDFTISGSLVAIITVAVSEKRQRLGDVIAGTTLVKTKSRTNLDDTLYVHTTSAEYAVLYPEVINLNDRDIQLVKEVLINVHRSGNIQLALQAQQKVEMVLKIASNQPDAVSFLQKILSDYNHLASQL
jgi:uncharacterized RDD family membrane protein YckC